jgi:hypothetical protein
MTDNDRKEAIKEVLKWVKSGKQDLQNGAEEIENIFRLSLMEFLRVSIREWCSYKPKQRR